MLCKRIKGARPQIQQPGVSGPLFLLLTVPVLLPCASWENAALVLGIVAVFVWWHYHSATYANLILQPAIAISFLPTLRGVWRNPGFEKPLPWFIWSPAYIFLMAAIFLEWENKPLQLVYPINCLVLHALVGIWSLRRT